MKLTTKLCQDLSKPICKILKIPLPYFHFWPKFAQPAIYGRTLAGPVRSDIWLNKSKNQDFLEFITTLSHELIHVWEGFNGVRISHREIYTNHPLISAAVAAAILIKGDN